MYVVLCCVRLITIVIIVLTRGNSLIYFLFFALQTNFKVGEFERLGLLHTLVYLQLYVSLLPGIVQFMLKQAGPSSTQLSSADEANEFAPSEEEARVIAFLPEGRSLERYKEVGNQLRQFVKLGHCTSEEVARAMGFKMGSVVVYCNK